MARKSTISRLEAYIVAVFLLVGAVLWVVDAVADFLVFIPGDMPFWQHLLTGANRHELFVRAIFFFFALLAAVAVVFVERARARNRERLEHVNRVLLGIRNVNQLITQTEDRESLLSGACRMLVETRSLYNARIGIVNGDQAVKIYQYASEEGELADIKERMTGEEMACCATAVLESDEVYVAEHPAIDCRGCPLAAGYVQRAGLAVRIEHGECVFGWLSVSVPRAFAQDPEEHGLLQEVAGDLGFALWGIETAEQRQWIEGEHAAVLDSINDAVIAINLEGHITMFNPGAEHLLGYSREEMIGQFIGLICPPDLEEEQQRALHIVMERGALRGMETERATKDGRRVPVEINLSLRTDDTGQPMGYVGSLRDITERLKAEEKLRHAYEIINSSPAVAFVWKNEEGWPVQYVSGNVQNLLGWTSADFRTGTIRYDQVVYSGDLELVSTEVAQAVSDRGVTAFAHEPYRVITKDGDTKWVDDRSSIRRNAAGEATQFEGVIIDITQRMEAEEALRASESRYRQLAETAHDVILVHDLDGVIEYVNPAGLELCGFHTEEMVGKNVSEFVPEEYHAEMRDRGRQRREGKQGRSLYELSFTNAAGGRAPLEVSSTLFQGDEHSASRVLVVGRDVSERREREEQLQFQAMLLDQIQDVITATDPEGRITYVNRATCAMMGLPASELIGQHVSVYGFDVTRGASQREMVESTLKDGEWRGQVVNFDTSGNETILDCRTQAVRDESGKIIAMAGISTDITDRIRLTEERDRLEEQYRQAQKMEAVGQLAGGVAHDFNNLLQVINGFTDMARQDMPEDSPVGSLLAEVADAGSKAARLVSHLLAFSRRQIMDPKSIDLNDVITDFLKMIRRVIGEDIRLDFAPGRGLEKVYADRGMIEQVLMNLCVNARDAMPEGGELTIETKNVVLDEEYSRTHSWIAPGPYICMKISDTGCGMDRETLDRVFEPFFTTKGLGRGTGLGLSTVYGIVKQHEGLITVHSEPSQGAKFRVYLPVQADTVSKEDRVGVAVDAGLPNGVETVLLAEDDEGVRRLARETLERAGYEVICAENGEDAVRLFSENPDRVDMLVFDLIMPKMGGKEAYARIREMRPEVPALFASGYSDGSVFTRYVLDEGMHLIQKPFGRRAFLQKLREVLDTN